MRLSRPQGLESSSGKQRTSSSRVSTAGFTRQNNQRTSSKHLSEETGSASWGWLFQEESCRTSARCEEACWSQGR